MHYIPHALLFCVAWISCLSLSSHAAKTSNPEGLSAIFDVLSTSLNHHNEVGNVKSFDFKRPIVVQNRRREARPQLNPNDSPDVLNSFNINGAPGSFAGLPGGAGGPGGFGVTGNGGPGGFNIGSLPTGFNPAALGSAGGFGGLNPGARNQGDFQFNQNDDSPLQYPLNYPGFNQAQLNQPQQNVQQIQQSRNPQNFFGQTNAGLNPQQFFLTGNPSDFAGFNSKRSQSIQDNINNANEGPNPNGDRNTLQNVDNGPNPIPINPLSHPSIRFDNNNRYAYRQNFYPFPGHHHHLAGNLFSQFDPLSAGAGGLQSLVGNRYANGIIYSNGNNPVPASAPQNPAGAASRPGPGPGPGPVRNIENIRGGSFAPGGGNYFGSLFSQGSGPYQALGFNSLAGTSSGFENNFARPNFPGRTPFSFGANPNFDGFFPSSATIGDNLGSTAPYRGQNAEVPTGNPSSNAQIGAPVSAQTTGAQVASPKPAQESQQQEEEGEKTTVEGSTQQEKDEQ